MSNFKKCYGILLRWGFLLVLPLSRYALQTRRVTDHPPSPLSPSTWGDYHDGRDLVLVRNQISQVIVNLIVMSDHGLRRGRGNMALVFVLGRDDRPRPVFGDITVALPGRWLGGSSETWTNIICMSGTIQH